LTVCVLLLSAALAQGQYMGRIGGNETYVPKPRLLEPIVDEVDLAGKKSLLFRWSPHEGRSFGRSYYDFRLYKGYQMLEGTRVLKRRVPPKEYQTAVEAGKFEKGQAYTWSLRQVYRGTGKSDRSVSSFKVIKK